MSDLNNNQNMNQKYNELGNEIKDSVLNAVNTGDFSGLSDSVNKMVYTALGDVGTTINRAVSQAGGMTEGQINYRERMSKAQETARRYHEEQEAQILRNKELRAARMAAAQNRPAASPIIRFNPVGSISGPIQFLIGLGLTIFNSILLVAALALFAAGDWGFFELLLFIGFVAISGAILGKGIKKNKMLTKARRIKNLCGRKLYCTISEISSALGISEARVIKDIREILSKGYFPEGYIDESCTTFMASREVYDQYKETMKHQEEATAESLEDAGISKEKTIHLNPAEQAELNVMMTEGRKMINRLHKLNDEIPGEVITEKLYKTENLLNDIFKRVGEHPEQIKNCHKLMNYHLPTMLKLVEAYAEYDKVSEPGPEIVRAKDEIEKTLDVINQAFTELLNRLFQDSVWDVTADAQVLKSMLTQEGLAKDIPVNQEG